MKTLFLLCFFVTLLTFAGKPSWKSYALHIDGIQSAADAELIRKSILAVDGKMIKTVKELTVESGYALILHDHHNITFQKIGQAILAVKDVRVYAKLVIPDYKKIQGSILGVKLNEILQKKGRGFTVKTIDAEKGSFEVVIQKGEFTGKGFNFGGLAHAISDPVVYGGLGLDLRYIGGGEDAVSGQMVKLVVGKELRFRKDGKKLKEYDPALLAAHKKLLNFPPQKLAEFYK
jgi:hypothetical protein